LKVRGAVLGVMNVRLPTTHVVAGQDVELLTSVADQIGVAIENARLFEAVSQQHERLRVLSSRLAEAEETERRRLAQELHDQVGRKLTALGINLNIIRTEMPKDGSQKVSSLLVESQDLVERTTQLIRGVMSELRPPMLDDLGLVDTLHWYGNNLPPAQGSPSI
jgi:signal transduction histidine kinase